MKVLYVSFVVVLIDQVTKLIVKGVSIPFLNIAINGMYIGQKIHLIGNNINIAYVENPGIAFGINPGNSIKIFISLFSIVACLALFIYIYMNRTKTFNYRFSLALILGGALGNLIDRMFYGIIFGYAPLFYGRVVDFFNIRFFDIFILNRILGSYVFNVADAAVTAGVIYFLIVLNKVRRAEAAEIENLLAENKD